MLIKVDCPDCGTEVVHLPGKCAGCICGRMVGNLTPYKEDLMQNLKDDSKDCNCGVWKVYGADVMEGHSDWCDLVSEEYD